MLNRLSTEFAIIVWFPSYDVPEGREFLRTLPEVLDSIRPS